MRDSPGTSRKPRKTSMSSSTPATKRAVAAQKKYGKPTSISEAGVGTYAAVKIAQTAAKALTKKAPAKKKAIFSRTNVGGGKRA